MDPVEAATLGDPDAVAAIKAAIADHHARHPDRPPRGRIVIALVEVTELPVARSRSISMAIPLAVVCGQRLISPLRGFAGLLVGIRLCLVHLSTTRTARDRRFPECSCRPLLISIAEHSVQAPTIMGGWP
jgi:hypothetical protein